MVAGNGHGQTVFGEGEGAIYLGMLAVGDPIDN